MAKPIIELIKVLRERTGAGMMDCKKALEETDCDIEKACDWLREKGIAKAAKKASRIAAEGLTFVKACDKCGKAIIIEVNCETDFVAKSDAFKTLVEEVAHLIMQNDIKTVEEAKAHPAIAELFTNATVKIGEKLDLRRFEIVALNGEESFGTYIHMGGKISVLVVLDKADEAAKGIAMHIAANNPLYINKEDIPADVLAHETAIQMEASKADEKLANKPEAVVKKIVEGKVNKQLSETTLAEQDYLLEPGTSVGNFLKQHSIKVVKFVRYMVGEGIEKRKDDFASEVMSQLK
ncbi:MAG: translation elongation factor Ts [Erysipelotrichaceae bacterium]|nr:translation elongation factor Ts [Erysipelotrichaceae bacterium]